MTDLNSINGTFVNGNKLNGFIMLQPKDEVFLGSGFKFQWEQIISSSSNQNDTSISDKNKSTTTKKHTDAYEKAPINNKVKVKKPFFKEHLDLILIYGFIVLFCLYCYFKVS